MSLRAVNGVQLDVEETGSCDPLILVHGSWDDVTTWERVTGGFAEHFRVITYSRRGHSRSQSGQGPGSRRQDEDDLAALIDELAGGRSYVASNSFGGAIALGLAARRPELFRALAAHEPPLLSLAGNDPLVQQVGQGVAPIVELINRGDHEGAAQTFVDDIAIGPGAWQQTPPDVQAMVTANAPTFADEMADPDWNVIDLDALGRLGRPVLLTKGDQSPPFFAAIIDRLAAAIPGARVQTLAGAGHIPHETNPVEYVAAVSAFLRESP